MDFSKSNVLSILLSCAFFLSFAELSHAQMSIRLGPVIGLTTPTVDYSGDPKDFYSGTKYGLRSALNYGAQGKITLGPIRGRLSVSYSSLENNGPSGSNNGTVEIRNNLFMFTLGTEFTFGVPGSPVKPYGGVDLLFSSISGSFRFQGTSHVPSDEKSIQSASRTGLGVSIGAEVSLGRSYSVDLSLRYNLNNLFGKEYKVISNANRVDAYTSLNDAKDPDYDPNDNKHPIGNDRSIVTIQLQLGLLFGF